MAGLEMVAAPVFMLSICGLKCISVCRCFTGGYNAGAWDEVADRRGQQKER